MRLSKEALPDLALLALALAGGAVDAASFLGLGRVFTANMTGNTILLSIAIARGLGMRALHSATALVGFSVGVATGAGLIVTGRDSWLQRVRHALALELTALVALIVLWGTQGVTPIRYELIVISAVAMGAQSAIVRASDVRGVNTTYVTGTFVNAVALAVQRLRGIHQQRGGPVLPGLAWITYGAGALAGAVIVSQWQEAVLSIPIAIVLAILVADAVNAGEFPYRRPGSKPRAPRLEQQRR